MPAFTSPLLNKLPGTGVITPEDDELDEEEEELDELEEALDAPLAELEVEVDPPQAPSNRVVASRTPT